MNTIKYANRCLVPTLKCDVKINSNFAKLLSGNVYYRNFIKRSSFLIIIWFYLKIIDIIFGYNFVDMKPKNND